MIYDSITALQLALRQLEVECDWGLLDASMLFCNMFQAVFMLR